MRDSAEFAEHLRFAHRWGTERNFYLCTSLPLIVSQLDFVTEVITMRFTHPTPFDNILHQAKYYTP